MTPRTALPIPDDHWRSRWLVLPSWGRLHRVSDIEWDDEYMIGGTGTTLCGRTGYLTMPGVFSRLGKPRCARCCRLAGVPEGDGAPFNGHIEEASDD
jgi:hypothetical protein